MLCERNKYTQFQLTQTTMTTNRTTLAYVLIMREGEGGDHMFILNPDVFMLNCCGKFEGSI